MEKLQDLSQSELEEILENAERVESMALESDEIQNLQLEREMALASNRNLAEQNLEFRPQLHQLKQTLVERYTLLEAAREVYTQHCSQRDGMVGQVSPEALFSRLQTEGAKSETESEALADDFLVGSLPLDSFLERFLSLRSLAHKRRARTEKLQELLRDRSADSSGMTMAAACGGGQDPAAAPATTCSINQPPQPPSQTSSCSSSSSCVASSSGGPALPYPPYPVSLPQAPPSAASGPATSAQFPPYPSSGSPFSPAGGYSGPRPAFGPVAPGCPYPNQPSFPGPHPGSAFGQYSPSPPVAPYPGSYSYGGYGYPANAPQGRPLYRPGYGMPQPYS